jgi:ferredoxin
VIGVRERSDRFAYGELSSSSELRLDHDVTILPPKKFFLPPVEDLVRFSKRDGFESVVDETPFVLLGVHPYDVFAISQLDTLFSNDNRDVHYMTRRERATIIACDVETPSGDVFAGHMGTAVIETGFDILLTKTGESYLVEIATEKGEAAAERIMNAPNATDADIQAREDVWKRNALALRQYELRPAVGYLPHLLAEAYTHPVWEERARNCFSCGSCNLVCPTCYCFDVQDDFNWDMESARRYRIWDGCMLSEFALVAGDHNFRPDKAERFRHRYYRKGKYIPDKIGQTGCVGCGRCVTACVANIANPVEVYNRLVEGS